MRSRDVFWKVETLLWTVESFMMAGRNCIMNGRDFYDDSPMFYYEQSNFSWWQIENFVTTGQNVIMNGQDFQDDGSRFSWWQLEISMTCWDFCEKRSRFSMIPLNLEGWGEHLTKPALMVYFQICSHMSWSIHPGNGIIFRFRWCPVQERCWCGFNKK